MRFPSVSKLIMNDLEPHNGRYFALFPKSEHVKHGRIYKFLFRDKGGQTPGQGGTSSWAYEWWA